MNKKRARTIQLMEVCGTHTVSIARFGLRSLFPAGVKMLSGPGCPVCVTPLADIDRAIAVGRLPGVTLATFGDMLHVPGSRSSLASEHARGTDVRVVYSPADALELAESAPDREIVLLGVGFETTSPTIAAVLIAARKRKLRNFSVLAMFKTVPKALRTILSAGKTRIDGFLLPGHVSAIIGEEPYRFLASEFGVPGVIGGFEPQDILRSVELLLEQVREGRPRIEIQYTRVVRPEGNPAALRLLRDVFMPADAVWRAIGTIPGSGLVLRPEFAAFDAARKFPVEVPPAREPKGCACGEILMGLKNPVQCRLFGTACTPAHPVGPCMVSSEGACAAVHKYGEGINVTLGKPSHEKKPR